MKAHNLLFVICLIASLFFWLAGDTVMLRLYQNSYEKDTPSVAVTTQMVVNGSPYHICAQNPYLGAIDEPFHVIASRADAWLSNILVSMERANDSLMLNTNHLRFFPFEEMASCQNRSISCIGGRCRTDQSKIMCGINELKKDKGCIVYSIGGNNQWAFEEDVLRKTPCEVHTFDCTGSISRFHKPNNDRLHFHHVCLGAKSAEAPETCGGTETICGEVWTLLETQRNLNHSRIDLLKMDIEGYEWPIFEAWPELADKSVSEQPLLPMQVLVEVHYHTVFQDLWHHYNVSGDSGYFRFPLDIVKFQAHLLKMGYVVVMRDDNRACGHCTELTLLRIGCPGAMNTNHK
jgi:Methyltransferase domain